MNDDNNLPRKDANPIAALVELCFVVIIVSGTIKFVMWCFM